MTIRENLKTVRNEIVQTCKQIGRDSEEVTLVAVTKTYPVSKLQEAIEAEQLVFGENYVQEAVVKIDELRRYYPGKDLKFHFIGNLQRNKVKQVVTKFDLIETVDRIELIQEIDKEAAKLNKRVPFLLQVNISGEDSKGGMQPKLLKEVSEISLKLPNVELKGLMSIGSPPSSGQGIVEFKEMWRLKSDLENFIGRALPELSMGMSEDFKVALEYGATIVRIGSKIFGVRQ